MKKLLITIALLFLLSSCISGRSLLVGTVKAVSDEAGNVLDATIPHEWEE